MSLGTESFSIVYVLGAGSIAIALLTALSQAAGSGAALRTLFILPVWFGTRLSGRIGGFLLVSMATVANVWLDMQQGVDRYSVMSSGLIWLGVFALVMLLVAQVEDSLNLSERLANQDPLTGLHNRRGLEIEGRRLVNRTSKQKGTVTVAMIDCDRFKLVNDQFGHRAGDETLRFLAQTIRANTRESDVLSRLGGDEFVLVLANTGFAEGRAAMDRIQAAFESGMAERGFDVSLSIGLAEMSGDVRDLRTLVAYADRQMYDRKESKRTDAIAS